MLWYPRAPTYTPGAQVQPGQFLLSNYQSYTDILYYAFRFSPLFAFPPSKWSQTECPPVCGLILQFSSAMLSRIPSSLFFISLELLISPGRVTLRLYTHTTVWQGKLRLMTTWQAFTHTLFIQSAPWDESQVGFLSNQYLQASHNTLPLNSASAYVKPRMTPQSKTQCISVDDAMTHAKKHGRPIIVFSEGTTSNGKGLLAPQPVLEPLTRNVKPRTFNVGGIR